MTKVALLPGITQSPQMCLAEALGRVEDIGRVLIVTMNKEGEEMDIAWASMSAKDLAAVSLVIQAYAVQRLMEPADEASETSAS